MVFRKWSPVGSQSTDLSSPVMKGVTPAESDAQAHFVDTIDTLSLRPIGTSSRSPRRLPSAKSSIKHRSPSPNLFSVSAFKSYASLPGLCSPRGIYFTLAQFDAGRPLISSAKILAERSTRPKRRLSDDLAGSTARMSSTTCGATSRVFPSRAIARNRLARM